ncbi:MAG TPA: sporulation integral membrane protein YlbJ [Clostridium sp.]|nr:sporulation integral membrane protein YlbJ [Clostridium sp.]
MYLFLLVITVVTLFFFIKKTSYIIYLKSFLLPTVCILFILLLIIFPNTAVESAKEGLDLWFKTVFPSLFPFLVASDILNKTGIIKSLGILLEPIMRPLFNLPGCASFTLLMGLTCGAPVGAKLTSSLRKEKLLTKVESERLLAFTNNLGPLFITGAVAVGMFKMPSIGVLLLACHILASLTVGLLFRFYGKNPKYKKENHREKNHNKNFIRKFKTEFRKTLNDSISSPAKILGDSIQNSLGTMLTVGGFITLFSVIINILIETGFISYISNVIFTIFISTGINKEIITALLSGFFEITTGTHLASEANSSFIQQLISVSLIMGWAGISVHFQIYSMISKTDINMKPYLFGKLLQGIFAAIYTFIGVKFINLYPSLSLPVFNFIHSSHTLSWHQYFVISLYNILISISIFILMSFVILFFNLFKKRKILSN